MEEYMDQLEHMLGTDEKVEKSVLQKFFGFFRAHPRLIGLGVIILMLLSPVLPSVAVVGLMVVGAVILFVIIMVQVIINRTATTSSSASNSTTTSTNNTPA